MTLIEMITTKWFLKFVFRLQSRLVFPALCSMMLFALTSSDCTCQTNETDSLVRQVRMAQTDEEKLNAILEACQRNDIDAETFNEFAFASKMLAEKSGDEKKMGLSAYHIAWAHYLNSNNDSARISIDEALKKLDLQNPSLADVIYKLRSFKATTYQSEQNSTEALRILFPLLDDVQKRSNKLHIAQTMHLIAIVESQQKNALKTIEWERQALPLLNDGDANTNNVRSTVLATLGKAWLQLNNTDSAIYYNNLSIENFEKNEDLYNLAIVLQRQAKLYTGINQLSKAEPLLTKLSALNDKIHMGEGDMNYWMAFIDFNIQSKNFDKAIELINGRLEKAGDNTERSATKWGIRLAYFEALAKCYKAQQNELKYASTLESVLMAKDSLYAINSADAIAEIQTKYEVQKKENTIIEQKLQISQKNALMYGGLVLFVLVSMMIWLHFRNNARRQKLRMELQQKEDQMKADKAVHEAEENERKRIAADLHDNLGSYAASIVSNTQHLDPRDFNSALLKELRENSQAMVSLLNDTIWALKKDHMYLTTISDRIKLLLQRLGRSYPEIQLEVLEEIKNDILFQPSQAYQLFSIIHEAVINATKHSGGNTIHVVFHSSSARNFVVRIEDNGNGIANNFPKDGPGNGLNNMRQRAGVLNWKIEWKQKNPTGIAVEIKQTNSN